MAEAYYRTLLETLPQGVQECNLEGTITFSNLAHARMLGYSPGELVGKAIWDFRVSDEAKGEVQDYLRLLVRDQPAPTPCFAKNRTKDGRVIDVRVDWAYRHDATGRLEGFVAIVTDITDHVRATQQLEAHQRLLETIHEVQLHAISNEDVHRTFERLLEAVISVTESEYGFMGEVRHRDDGRPYLKTHAISNIAWNDETRRFYEQHAPAGLEFTNMQSLYGAVITSGEPVIANDPSRDPRSSGIPDGHPPIKHFLGLPLFAKGELIGAVGVANRLHGYDEGLVQYIRPLVSTCGAILGAHRNDQIRKNYEHKLRAEEARLRSIVSTSTDAIVVADSHGIVQLVSQSVERVFGWGPDELVGRNVAMLMPEPLRSEHNGYLEIYQHTQKATILGTTKEAQAVRKDGSTFPCDITLTRVEVPGEAEPFFTAIIRDVSARKQAEEARRRTERLAAVGTLAAGIAHEINNPVGAALVTAETALAIVDEPASRATLEACLKNIITSMSRCGRIVNDLLKFSRGKPTERSLGDVNEVVRQSLNLVTSYAKKQQASIQARLADDLPDIPMNPLEIELAVSNVLHNAIYSKTQGARIEVGTEKTQHGIRIWVQDDGCGMTPEQTQRVFDPFYSVRETEPGTGLGMSIVHDIVQQHGGSTDVQSAVGQGTTVSIELPLATA